jgi:hypothetical protein
MPARAGAGGGAAVFRDDIDRRRRGRRRGREEESIGGCRSPKYRRGNEFPRTIIPLGGIDGEERAGEPD